MRPLLPPRPRCWRGAALLSAAAMFVPAMALAQDGEGVQRLRARDLSVIEDLLSTSIADSIQVNVQLVNAANRREQEAAAGASGTPEFRYMFRISGDTRARGMFLKDYGVIFTIQVPTLSASPTAVLVGSDNSISIVTPDTLVMGELARDIQLRAQLSRMQAEIQTMTQRLQEIATETGATSDKAQRLQASIAQLETDYAAYAAENEKFHEVPSTGTRQQRVPTRRAGIRMLSMADPEAMALAEALAEKQRAEISSSVIDAVVDTFAHYGTVIHGLEGNDRLAAVLLPSSYLDRIASWTRATERAEEFIISVRYRDIEALDEGRIDDTEFADRIRVENRLGRSRVGGRQDDEQR